MTDSIRFGIYCTVIAGYAAATIVECIIREWKAALIAGLLGIINGIIFLWR